MEKICKRCGERFTKPYNESKKNWIFRHIYCSRECCYPKKIIRICQQCGKEFSVRGKRKYIAKFCSKKCNSKFLVGKPNTSFTKFKKGHKTWNKDKKGIMPIPWNKNTKGICKPSSGSFKKGHIPATKGKELLHLRDENACHWKGGKIEKICIFCGKKFYVNQYRKNAAKFCSKKCGALWRRGSNTGNWKGGIDLENKRIRHSLEYEIWRNEVYKRDNWTCRICEKKCNSKNIIAHHLKLFSEFPELRFSIDNGITLCRSCHKKIHKEIGYETRFKRKH